MVGTRTRRRLLWVGIALLVLVVLRFVVRWADATGRLAAGDGLGDAVLTVLLLLVLVCGVLLIWRGQTRKNR